MRPHSYVLTNMCRVPISIKLLRLIKEIHPSSAFPLKKAKRMREIERALGVSSHKGLQTETVDRMCARGDTKKASN